MYVCTIVHTPRFRIRDDIRLLQLRIGQDIAEFDPAVAAALAAQP